MDTRTYRLHPPFLACIKWAIGYGGIGLAFSAALAFVLGEITRPVRTDLPWLGGLGLLVCGIFVSLATIAYVMSRLYGAVLDERGIRVSTYWGRRVHVPWNTITHIDVCSFEAMPHVELRSSDEDAALYFNILGVKPNEIHRAIAAAAGHEHPVARAFAPDE